jgi:hypothetical protein
MFPLTFKESIALVIIRQVLFGLSIGPQMVGSFAAGSEELIRYGYEKGMAASSSFSALYTSSMTLG